MHILISGAGIAGPTLAYWAAKAGARVTVVEKAASFLASGQNIDVSGSALQIIGKMGLMDELRRLNTTEKGTQLIDQRGRPFAKFPVKEEGASPTSEFEILRGDLAAMLYESTKSLPNITYHFYTTVQKVLSNGNDKVQVQLSTGATHSYDLLVAADGQWSKIRTQCFPAESIRVVDKNMMAVYATIPRIPSDNNWWNIYFALGSRIVATGPKAQKELLRKEFADAGWQAQRLLDGMEKAEDFYLHVFQQIKMSTWSAGRVICLGDAAYAPTPLSSSGAGIAIMGAYVLAGELSKLVLKPDENGNENDSETEHPRTALQAYETVFRPFVEQTQEIPFFFPAIVHPETAWKRWLTQTFLWTLSK
ncbi:hypothetical protein B0A55_12504 [Friedmanniomyces simplex]|uniref:FAD-binding domain-containing protein n=2 Tax=Friedmanniomyces simplex TaxID=329884 RepID=A0A4U0W998_9PEZI|nr:hypothetical protein B0A55_12504 [Friedmanniomyces simplex]